MSHLNNVLIIRCSEQRMLSTFFDKVLGENTLEGVPMLIFLDGTSHPV